MILFRINAPLRQGATMWLRNPLDDIMSSPAKVAVLRVVSRVNGPLSGREIIRRAGVGYGQGWRALQALAASGVLSKQDHGRASTYAVSDPRAPIMTRLRDLFAQEDRRTREAVAELKKRVPETLTIILFGSEARGEARPGSDTDLLIVVPRKSAKAEARVRGACLDLAEKHHLALAWHVVDPDGLRDWDVAGHPFWRNVLQDGVTLQGDSLEALRRRWQPGRTS